MFSHRFTITALLALVFGLLSASAGVLFGQERKDPDPAKHEEQLTLQALDQRLRILEQRIEVLLGRADAGAHQGIDRETIRRIRPRFECLVEKVKVKVGQKLSKGDPLADLFSSKLVFAKNDLLTKTFQWRRDKTLLDLRRKLVDAGAISNQLWRETQENEEKSRLEVSAARDHLLFLGLSPSEIGLVEKEEGEQKAQFTLRSPVDGRVIETGVESGDVADPGTILVVIVMPQP